MHYIVSLTFLDFSFLISIQVKVSIVLNINITITSTMGISRLHQKYTPNKTDGTVWSNFTIYTSDCDRHDYDDNWSPTQSDSLTPFPPYIYPKSDPRARRLGRLLASNVMDLTEEKIQQLYIPPSSTFDQYLRTLRAQPPSVKQTAWGSSNEVRTYVWVSMFVVGVYIYIYIYVCVYVCMYVCIYICMYVCT